MDISYQGLEGSYSYQACKDIYPEADLHGYKSFYNVVTAVVDDKADIAMLPVENSSAGRVMEVHNILRDSGLFIVGEYLLPIHHNLMIPRKSFRGTPPLSIKKEDLQEWKQSDLSPEEYKTAMDSIVEVRSHPQALTQCRNFIQKELPKAVAVPSYDTAEAARDISGSDNAKVAAIASLSAGRKFNMLILKENIEDASTNTTRFLLLSKKMNTEKEIEGSAITTLLFDTLHEPGSLIKALQIFQNYGINLLKLETYMSGPTNPLPSFYVDVGGSVFDENVRNALNEFKTVTQSYSILGCYNASKERGKDNGFLAI